MWIPKFKIGDVVILRKPFGSGVQVSSAEGRGNIWIPDIMDKFNNGFYEVECANEKSYRLKGMNLAIDEDWLVELKPLSKWKKGDTLVVIGPAFGAPQIGWCDEHAKYLNTGMIVNVVFEGIGGENKYRFNGCDLVFLESWLSDNLKTSGVGVNAPKVENDSQYTDKADRSNLDPRGVNHPTHYNAHPSGIECIEVVRHMNFNLGSAVKYVWRIGLKPVHDAVTPEDDLKDLEKAIWYIRDEINRCKAVNKKIEDKK